MKKLILFLILLLSNNIFAELKSIKEAPLAVKYKKVCKINDKGGSKCTESKYITILTDEGKGLKEIARIDFLYSKYDNFSLNLAEYFKPNSKKSIALDKSMIEVKIPPEPKKGISNKRQTSIFFPNLKKGSTIHYVIEHKYKGKPYYDGFYKEINIPPSNIRYDEYQVTYEANTPIFIEAENDEKLKIKQSKNKKQVTIELKTPYYNAYANENININAQRFFLNTPRVVIAHSKKVEDHIINKSKLYQKVLIESLPLKAQKVVDNLKNKNDIEKINGIMKYIYKNYRYLGDWRESTRGHAPNSLQKIVNNGYGDCKDLASLATAMLRNLNLDAKIALLYRGKYAKKLLIPGFYTTNHAIVRVQNNGNTYWLDPTNRSFDLEQQYFDISNRWALILDDNKITIENIPEHEMTIIKIKKEIKLLDKSVANLKTSYQYSREPVLLNKNDRNNGKLSTDRNICKNEANELVLNSCKVIRDQNEFLLKKNYQIEISYQDKQFLKNIAPNIYLYEEKYLNNLFNELKKYKNNNHQADLYMNDGKYKNIKNLLLIGYKIPENRYCEVNSKWFYLKLDTKPIKDNVTDIYTEFIFKQGWLLHKDIVSKEFQDNITKLSACIKKSNLIIENNN